MRTAYLLAHNHFQRTRFVLLAYGGGTDIDDAKRDKAIKRAQGLLERKLTVARLVHTRQLQQIRRRAGKLAKLVPVISR